MSIDDASPAEWDAAAKKSESPVWEEHKPEEDKVITQVFQRKSPKTCVVERPPHYNQGGIECIDYIKQQLGDNITGYYQGNVIKYLHRFRYKNGIEDLRKCRWYLDKLIEHEVNNV
jgi:hypothetical protein